MTVTVVSTIAGLAAALAAAHGGDTIKLAPGVYERPVLKGAFEAPVTITSQHPARPAIIVGFVIQGQSLTLTNLEFSTVGAADPYYAWRVVDSSNITFSHDDFHGDPSRPPGEQPLGLLLSGSSRIAITDSTFHDQRAGITVTDVDTLNVLRNAFTRVSKGGMTIRQLSNANISDNVFTDFASKPGEHADCVQFTSAGTKRPSRDITISNNLCSRGSGTVSQGLFLQDEVGTLPITNLTLTGNLVLGEQWNSIWLNGLAGQVTIADNVVAGWVGPGSDNVTPTDYIPRLILRGDIRGARISMTGNRAQQFVDATGNGDVPPGNFLIRQPRDRGAALLSAWARAHGGATKPGIMQ